jgi:uncharacterized damage-inducible protein DinB
MAECVEACFGNLSEEQIWQRHAAHENTIGNLILHLCGNIRQWIMHGVANHADVRTRDVEFSTIKGLTKTKLLGLFLATVAEAETVIAVLPHERLTDRTDPQQRGEVSVLDAIYQVVGHVQQHTGQIILLTKQMTNSDLDLTIPRPR